MLVSWLQIWNHKLTFKVKLPITPQEVGIADGVSKHEVEVWLTVVELPTAVPDGEEELEPDVKAPSAEVVVMPEGLEDGPVA